MNERRFPLPWRVDEATESFRIRDASGQALAYVYYEDEKGRRDVMNRLTRDEAGGSRPTSPSCRNCCADVIQGAKLCHTIPDPWGRQ
jgi:hypothetical protein